MSCFQVITQDGHKMCFPVKTREEYMALRNSRANLANLRRARNGYEPAKHNLVQMNYSCLPNDDGSLKGTTRMSTVVGMDIDFEAPVGFSVQEQQAWLTKQMEGVPELVLSKKEELGLMMLERSATKGYHLAFRRRPELSQEENLTWASNLLGVKFDDKAKDITRVFFSTSASEEDLIYLSDEIFEVKEVKVPALPPEASAEEVKEVKDDTTSDINSQPLETSLTAFDLCVEQAGLKPGAMDVWGEHNWHSNLMAVLSVGVGKLMSREQLLAVVAKRLPNYSQTEDCKKLINYFYDNYNADKGFMSTTLREINAKAQGVSPRGNCPLVAEQLGSVSDGGPKGLEGAEEADRDMECLTQGWNPPPLPQKLPRFIALLIKPFPSQYHPMLVVTACVILGTIASHFRSIYLDGRTIAANLYAAIIAGSGKGKNWVTMLVELMCRPTLQTWDDQEWRKVRENQEMRDKMANSKDKPAKYHPKFRIMETMSKTSLLEVQTNLGENGMVLCNYTESDELANASRTQFSNISVLLRKAWDLATHRQFFMSEASCNTQCRLCAAILLTGTPKSVLTRLFSDTENGMMQRFIPLITPNIKRTFRPPVFTPLSADEEAERDGLLVNLWQKDLSLGDGTLMLEMPKTQKMIQAWYDELEERYNDGELTEAEADLSHRVGQFMQRAAIPFVALYGEEQKEVIDLGRWLGDFAYYNICHIFATRVSQDIKESEQMLQQNVNERPTVEPLLNRMPSIFTIKQFREERIRQGQSGEVKMILSRYCKKGKIERIGIGMYRNLKVTGNMLL